MHRRFNNFYFQFFNWFNYTKNSFILLLEAVEGSIGPSVSSATLYPGDKLRFHSESLDIINTQDGIALVGIEIPDDFVGTTGWIGSYWC